MAKIIINDDKIIESYLAFNENLENVEKEAIEDAKTVAYQRGLNETQTNRLVDLMKDFKREDVKDTITFWNKLEEMGFMDFVVDSDEVVEAITEDNEVVNFDFNGDEYNG